MEYDKYIEILDLCFGVQNKQDLFGWETLNKFDNLIADKTFDYKIYKNGKRIVIAFSGADINQSDDLKNALIIITTSNIPQQYFYAKYLYECISKDKSYKGCSIEFVGYSLGGTLANLMSHHTGLPSTALAPIGSKHIVKAHKEEFPYDDSKIITYGRKSDLLFKINLDSQSGKIYIIPDIDKQEVGISHNFFENYYSVAQHMLHNYSPYNLYQANKYNLNKNIRTGDYDGIDGQVHNSSKFGTYNHLISQPNTILTDSKQNTDNAVYTYGLGDGSDVSGNNFSQNSADYARFPKLNSNPDYNNIPKIDFSNLFKTKIPDNIPPQNTYQTPRYKTDSNTNSIGGITHNINARNELINILFNVLKNIPTDRPDDYSDYTNPLTGNKRIFTREEIGAMSGNEFAKYEKEIMAQIKSFNKLRLALNGNASN